MNEPLLSAAVAGLLAGLGVAMPLGAIGVLILRESMINGFRRGAAGAAGVALVDLVYCSLALSVGVAIAPAIQSWGGVPAVISGAVLVGLGAYQLLHQRRGTAASDVDVPGHHVFARFVGLTAVNPATLLYFLALASVVTADSRQPLVPVIFAAAAGLASLGWQLGLAVVGARVGASIPARVSTGLGIAASGVVIILGIAVAVAGLAGSR